MAITVEEKPFGRRTSAKSAERQYVIRDSGGADITESQALAALIAGVPSTVSGLSLATSDCEVDEIAKNIFVGTASYSSPSGSGENQEVGDFTITFDISGQQQRMMKSLSTVNSYEHPLEPERNFSQAIGVNSDGTIEGCDILIPTFTFTLHYTVDPADITESYVATLARTVGKVNSDAYKGFAAGELLLTRVSGQRRDLEAWDLTFGFSVSENKTGLEVFPITGIAKDGWDYLWVYYTTVENQGTHVLEKRAANVYVERVYERVAFASTLNLP